MTRFGRPVSPASIVGLLLFAVGLSAFAEPATAGQGRRPQPASWARLRTGRGLSFRA